MRSLGGIFVKSVGVGAGFLGLSSSSAVGDPCLKFVMVEVFRRFSVGRFHFLKINPL
jgi:hypothetical protein